MMIGVLLLCVLTASRADDACQTDLQGLTGQPPAIEVTMPEARSIWVPGSSYTIQWKSSEKVGEHISLRLWLKTDPTSICCGNDFVQDIAPSVSNSGQYVWSIPENVQPGWHFITVHSLSNFGVSTSSSLFLIDTPDR
jgi:hypothetical protein